MIAPAKYIFLLVSILALQCGGSKKQQQVDRIPGSSLEAYGRYQIIANKELELISSGVHFSFSFQGKDCKLLYSLPDKNNHSYLQYEIDDKYQRRIRIEGNSKTPLLIDAGHDGKHTVTIYKTTEATSGSIIIEGIEAASVKSVPPARLPLIEFIGNSITCGAAADTADMPCGVGQYHDYHNAYFAYGPRVARALKTNFILNSVSGIGIYRTWNKEFPSMPLVYEKLHFEPGETQLWDYKKYSPAIVSIALGTNDLSNGDGVNRRLPFDSAAFVNHYVRFIQQVRSHYPDAQLALLSSPMVTGRNGRLLENSLLVVKQKVERLFPSSKPIALHFFKSIPPHGCGGHPGVEDHAIMAAELVPFFKNLLR